ncbi:MAG TPA: metallophosphoesterase [Planctomycetaceae bacterium]|nr:metallophosphoesterase [Planctomycetaceae bacterium]
MANAGVMKIAAMADLHVSKSPPDGLQAVLTQAASEADVLLLGGDLTDYGLIEEAQVLARLLASIQIPKLAVLGNHDYESNQEAEVLRILTDAGVKSIDGDSIEINGVGFAGVKGFAGGFGTGTLAPWGEQAIKIFVKEALDEALKLERALARLRTPHRIALLHYSPIQGTVEGEPVAIFPFLGTSRLEEPIERLGVTAVFHGHAHRGTPEGHTKSGIPVFNVALPLLRRRFPDRPPYHLHVIELRSAAHEAIEPQSAQPAAAD